MYLYCNSLRIFLMVLSNKVWTKFVPHFAVISLWLSGNVPVTQTRRLVSNPLLTPSHEGKMCVSRLIGEWLLEETVQLACWNVLVVAVEAECFCFLFALYSFFSFRTSAERLAPSTFQSFTNWSRNAYFSLVTGGCHCQGLCDWSPS